jgi:hypothetical protein
MTASTATEILVLRDQAGYIYILSRDVLDRARAAARAAQAVRSDAAEGPPPRRAPGCGRGPAGRAREPFGHGRGRSVEDADRAA